MTQPPELPQADATPPTPYAGSPVPPAYGSPVPPAYGQPIPGQAPWTPQPPQKSALYTAAAIINWVVMGLAIVGTLGLGIIVAAWFIPMTIYIQKGAKDRYKHTGLAVCTLLFCNLISGILMLVDNGNREPRPQV